MAKPDSTGALARELEALFGERLEPDAPLAGRVGYRVGGGADWLAPCSSEAEVAACRRLTLRYGLPLFVLGRGTNLLVRDGGIRGLVLVLEGGLARFERIETLPDGSARVRVGAGMTTGALVQRLTKESLGGTEFLALIPGTLGGAVVINAGAHGGEMSQILQSVRLVHADGEGADVPARALGLCYRHCELPPGAIVTSLVLRLAPAPPAEIRAKIKEHAEYRARTQPTGEPNAGSVFKNPPGDYAGRLLEAAALKGVRLGGARVSERHANFIVTQAGARAADIEALAEKMAAAVREKFGVELEREIKIVGEKA